MTAPLARLLRPAPLRAPGPAEVVLDEGAGFVYAPPPPEPDDLSESGRGMLIATLLTRDVRVNKRAVNGSHARAVLRLH